MKTIEEFFKKRISFDMDHNKSFENARIKEFFFLLG